MENKPQQVQYSFEADDYGLGRILFKESPVDYQLYEISKIHMAIITKGALETGTNVTLERREGTFELRVISSSHEGLPPEVCRYKMIALDKEVNLESMLDSRQAAKLHESDKPLQFSRFETIPPMDVNIGTFGLGAKRSMITLNISKSGCLIVAKTSASLPFKVSGLLEMSFQGEVYGLKDKFSCFGRVVRTFAAAKDNCPGLGIIFVDMTPDQKNIWYICVEKAENSVYDSLRS